LVRDDVLFGAQVILFVVCPLFCAYAMVFMRLRFFVMGERLVLFGVAEVFRDYF